MPRPVTAAAAVPAWRLARRPAGPLPASSCSKRGHSRKSAGRRGRAPPWMVGFLRATAHRGRLVLCVRPRVEQWCSVGCFPTRRSSAAPDTVRVAVTAPSASWHGGWCRDRDENSRERSGKPLNRFRNCIFLSGTETGTGKSDGKTKLVLRDIGNGINWSGACRLRSGIDNSKRENTYNHFKHLTR